MVEVTKFNNLELVLFVDVLLLCQFSMFRYHLGWFITWSLCYLDDSHLWTFWYQNVSLPPWMFRKLSESL